MKATINPLITTKSGYQKRYNYLITSRNKKLWPVVNGFYEREMKPALKYICDPELEGPIKTSLRKYLIISCVSLVEDILSLLTVRVIDQNGLPIASIVGVSSEAQANKKKKDFEKDKRLILTNGQYLALKSSFMNPDTIDQLFTDILNLNNDFRKLNMKFFDAVKKVDWYNPYRHFKGSRSMKVNWNRFTDIFEVRHRIVHNLKDVDLSDTILKSNCDNTVNFLDAAIYIMDLKVIGDVISQLKSTKRINRY